MFLMFGNMYCGICKELPVHQNVTHTGPEHPKKNFALSPQIRHEAATRNKPLGKVLYLLTFEF